MHVILPAVLLSAGPALAQEYGYPDNLDVPYVPSPDVAVKAMLKLAAVTKSDTVIDLVPTCGSKRIRR